MIKIISIKYLWNILSIILIIILAEGLFKHYSSVKKTHTELNQVYINLKCNFTLKNPKFTQYKFCQQHINSIKNPVLDYVLNEYNLYNKSVEIKKREGYFLTLRFKLKENQSNNVSFFKTEDFKKFVKINSKKIFEHLRENYILERNLAILNVANTYSSIFEKYSLYELQNDYTVMRLQLQRRWIYDRDLNKIKRRIQFMTQVDFNQMYTLTIENKIIKQKINSKYDKLNYFNVFFASLIFGIFLNIMFYIFLKIKNIYIQ